MIFNMTSGGGSELNFTVKAYATEAELLAATPKENTIGIITTTPITNWIFGSTEPEVAANGMVWIVTGESSTVEFNALKKNAIQVYPVYAKQYLSGAWENMNAEIYIGSKWTQFSSMWDGELFTPNNQWESVTGGWENNGSYDSSGRIVFSKTGVTICNKELITRGDYTKLTVNIVSGKATIVATKKRFSADDADMYAYIDSAPAGRPSINISNVPESGFYVLIYSTTSAGAVIDEIRME